MATKKTAQAKGDRVEVFIPRETGKGDPNLFVSVNGVNYLLPRGKTSLVPVGVAQELQRAEEARSAQEQRIDALLER